MTDQRILIEFLGGDMDGRTLDRNSPDVNERHMVEGCLKMTGDGTVGRAFHGVSMNTLEAMLRGEMTPSDLNRPKGSHQYTVSERVEDDAEVHIPTDPRSLLPPSGN